MQESMGLKYEPVWEPLHVSVKWMVIPTVEYELSPKVNLPHKIDFGAICGAYLATQRSKIRANESPKVDTHTPGPCINTGVCVVSHTPSPCIKRHENLVVVSLVVWVVSSRWIRRSAATEQRGNHLKYSKDLHLKGTASVRP